MSATVSLISIYKSYQLLLACNLFGLSDEDKLGMWRNIKTMKPIADKVDEGIKIAKEKFRPCADYESKLMNARDFEKNLLQSENFEGLSEYQNFMEMYDKYNELIDKAMDDYSEEIPIDIYHISDDSFEVLASSNKWEDEQSIFLKEILIS